MALTVVACFTHRTSVDSPWTDAQHSVSQFVAALKGRPLRGFGHVLVNRRPPLRKLEAENATDAVAWFGEMAAAILADECLTRDATLVPVPDGGSAMGVESSRTARLANAVAAEAGDCATVADVLRWDRVMPSASELGGARERWAVLSRFGERPRGSGHR